MTCPQCRHDNRAAARFCDNCGEALPRACAGCGTPLRAAAKFCDECGQPVGVAPAAAAPRAPAAARTAQAPTGYTPKHLADRILTSRSALEGERKQVTVVFVDCVGFTALSARLDPEDLHAVMDGCFQHLLDAVHRYEGTVNQFTGDGIMALFGAPIAHEDHAVRAVAAALAIQQAVRRYADALRTERGIEFAVRVGINTGPVVVGKIGDDLRMDYTAQGETVNLAARLQQAAPPGGTRLSEATTRLVDGYFLIEATGELTLKGLAEPVPAFTVTGQRSGRARFDLAVERGLTAFVGRQRELLFLRDAFDKARRGRGNVVSVVGAAGMGKSRLAYELKRGLDEHTVTFLSGRCHPHRETLPFDLIAQLLQMNFRLEDGEAEKAQVHKVEAGVRRLDASLEWAIPYLKHLLALPAAELDVDGLDASQRKRRLIEAVRALTLRGAQQRPLFLLMEDLQWIDSASREYLESVVDAMAAQPILVMCTYRDGYAPAWENRSFHQRLVLDPFSEEETAEMVTALFDGAAIAAPARELVIKRAEGNPLFIEELTGYLAHRGLLTGTAAAALAEAEVPATIQDLLTARIDRLPEPAKRVLQVAAVLGREFPLPLLEAITPPDADLPAELAALVRAELLGETTLFPEQRYRFVHLLVQQVAYQSLLVKSRAELHARAGQALEALYVERPEEALQELARHYGRSADRAKALHYLVLAGDRARSLFAYDDATAYYRQALHTLDERDPRRALVLEKLGDTAHAHGSLGDALRDFTDALGIVAGTADGRRAAELHRKLAVAAWDAGERERALDHLQRGLAALGDDTDNAEAARLYQELGRIHFRLGEHERSMEWARRALALGNALGAPDAVAHAYNTLGVALARAGDIEQAAGHVRQSLEVALAHQLGAIACRAYSNLAVMYAALDHVRSSEYCLQGLALAQRIGDQLQQAWLFCTLAGGHCTLAGDYDEGIKAAQAAVEVDRRLGQRGHLPVPLIILAQIHQCRGEAEESTRYYREALEIASVVGEPQFLCPCYDGLATLAIEAGDEAEAEAWLAKSRSVQEATGWTSDTFLVLPFLC
ncbi:MAG TPA: adenylate/guanylate cyclase domain-containing protein [Candidatus Limnocylindria bacterium]|nr:adenylate/guanylate cyclase domain-containing protein [Candidatus Limnocylindria bacterium]